MQFDKDRLIECMAGLVGWSQSFRAPECVDELNATLTTSYSGQLVNVNSPLTPEILQACKPIDYLTVESWLLATHDQQILELANWFLNKLQTKTGAKGVLSNTDLGVTIPAIRKTIQKLNKFVGFEIKPYQGSTTVVTVTHIGLCLNTAQTLKLYLYNDGDIDSVIQLDAVYVSAYKLQWFSIDQLTSDVGLFNLSYRNSQYHAGSRWYIGYYEADLQGKAIDTVYKSCCGYSNNENEFIDFVYISPVSMSGVQPEVGGLRPIFDTEGRGGSDRTYGLTIKINVRCDYTDIICSNKHLLATALRKKIATAILWDVYNASNERQLNSTKVVNKEDAMFFAQKNEMELFGNFQQGIKSELEKLAFDFSGLDSTCLPCNKQQIGTTSLV